MGIIIIYCSLCTRNKLWLKVLNKNKIDNKYLTSNCWRRRNLSSTLTVLALLKGKAILCSFPHIPIGFWDCVIWFPFPESTNEKPRVRSSATQYWTYSDSQMTCSLLGRSFRWQHLDEGVVLESPKAIPFHSSLDSHSLFNSSSSSCHLSMRRRRGEATFLPSFLLSRQMPKNGQNCANSYSWADETVSSIPLL